MLVLDGIGFVEDVVEDDDVNREVSPESRPTAFLSHSKMKLTFLILIRMTWNIHFILYNHPII